MTSVFIGGSRRLGRLNDELSRRLDNIVRKRFRVLVGDAKGFDRAAQAYLAEHGYDAVVVYCTEGACRNNIGTWSVHTVAYEGRDRGRAFYTAKDDAMLRDADYGLFAWDGKSEGTLRNIRKMAEQGKPSAVYVSPLKKFVTVRSIEDTSALWRESGADVVGSADLYSDGMRAGSTEEAEAVVGGKSASRAPETAGGPGHHVSGPQEAQEDSFQALTEHPLIRST